ncbi:hypothetical protein Tco_0470658 [Tanacetum coccineum]
MVVHVSHAMSPGLSASIAEVAAMSNSVFRKRFRSSYETSPSSSPPDLPSRKHSWGTSELVKDDEEEDEEVEESSDSDSESEDAGDEGPTTKDEGPAADDEGLVVGDEGPGIRVESLGLGRDEVEPEGQQRAASGIAEEERFRDEIFSQRYRLRSLEHEQERVTITFVAIWRPVLALESWAGQTDA